MDKQTFQAFWVEEPQPGQFHQSIITRTVSDLPPGDVLVRVLFSSLNYKDGLSASGNKGVTRQFPHIPGIDAAGIVEDSTDERFPAGSPVLIASPEFGVSKPGGWSQYARVPAAWLTLQPPGLSAYECMAYGSAGFTAALMVQKLQKAGVKPGDGEILVTGATGGVGSAAVGILAKAGFQAAAATGKMEQAGFLTGLGAARVIHRDEVNDTSGRPLLSGRWAGVVETVGGNYLATALRSTRPDGVVTACGNAASPEFAMTVYPFILRGISLIGIDATRPSSEERAHIWAKLAGEWKIDQLNSMAREAGLTQMQAEVRRILQGGQIGRVVVNLWKQ